MRKKVKFSEVNIGQEFYADFIDAYFENRRFKKGDTEYSLNKNGPSLYVGRWGDFLKTVDDMVEIEVEQEPVMVKFGDLKNGEYFTNLGHIMIKNKDDESVIVHSEISIEWVGVRQSYSIDEVVEKVEVEFKKETV